MNISIAQLVESLPPLLMVSISTGESTVMTFFETVQSSSLSLIHTLAYSSKLRYYNKDNIKKSHYNILKKKKTSAPITKYQTREFHAL